MRKTSKLLSLVLAVLMMLSIVSVSASAQFTDVSVDDVALNDAVNLLTTLGVAHGTTDTTFGPDENVTRQQMAAFIYRLMKAGKQVTGGDNTSGFEDLDDSTFYYMVSWAAKNGIIKGTSATTFNPKGGIKLQDAYVMVVRALGFENETTLPYPIGFIDVAEDIGLDEDLPSTLQYTDTLTRGQVAIILANAFYADMNETTTKYEWIEKKYNEKNSDGTSTEKSTWAYMPVDATETVAHKIFGVVEESFKVRATAHYAFSGFDTLYNERDVDRVEGYRYDEDGNYIDAPSYKLVDELGLTGSSDDYFMAELTLFVKKDEAKDVSKDVVLAAKSNLVKKTVTPDEVVLEKSNKSDDKQYYVNYDKTEDQVMTGYATFAGLKAYLDVKRAPYSYTDVEKKSSVKFIDLIGGSYDKDGHSTYKYALATKDDFDGDYALTASGAYDGLSNAFKTNYANIYNRGLYELEVYDVDGDGYAEYIVNKPYTFAQVRVKTNRDYNATLRTEGTAGSATAYNYFYTGKAVITGATYANEDFVLAYMPAGINYIEIKEVITPITSIVATRTNKTNTKTITLKSGETVEFVDAATKITNYNTNYTIGSASLEPGKSLTAYIKGDVLLYSKNITADSFDSDANYAIIVPYEAATATDPAKYLFEVGGVVDGEYKSYYYVKAIMGGALKSVKLADYAYAKYEFNSTSTALNAISTVESVKITDKKWAEWIVENVFKDTWSTYTVGSDSAYTFTQLEVPTLTADIFDDPNNGDSGLYINNGSLDIKHYTGDIYAITNGNICGMTKFNVKDYSKVIIKTVEDGEDVYTEYNAETLPEFANTTFKNIKAIFVNNKDGSIENLGILYAEVGDFGSKSAKDFRIVIGSYTKLNSNDKKTEYYTVLNPKDATTTEVEANTSSTTFVTNQIVQMREDGKAEDASLKSAYGDEDIFKTKFVGYDDANKFLDLGDSNTYVLTDNTTILYYTKSDVYEMTDTDILEIGEDNTIMDLVADQSFDIYVVAAESDDKNVDATVKTVKTIIAVDPAHSVSLS